MRYTLEYALNMGADFVEVRYEKITSESIIYRNRMLDNFMSSIDEGISIRLLYDGVLALSSTNTLTRMYLERVVSEAVSSARAGKGIPIKEYSFGEAEFDSVNYFIAESERWMSLDLESKIGFLHELDENVLDGKYEADFPSRLYILNYRLEEKHYINSQGADISSRIPRVNLVFNIIGKNGSETIHKVGQIGGCGGFEVVRNEDTFKEVRDLVNGLNNVLVKGRPTPTGKLDVVVDSEVAGIIAHEAVGHPFEADRVLGREKAQAGWSYIEKNMVGRRIGSEEVYVSDDPTIPGSYGFYLYDDEGVKARKRVLVKEGIVNELLHNRETASLFNVESNGAARAGGYDREPIVRMANTYFEAGDYSFEELIEDIPKGLYVKSFMEWNIDDFRINQRYVGLEAYLIEDGEISYPVKAPVIEVTTDKLLDSLDARGRVVKYYPGSCGKGDPMQPIPVWMGGPALRFRGLNIIRR